MEEWLSKHRFQSTVRRGCVWVGQFQPGSQASTIPAPPQSEVDTLEFDLTRGDSSTESLHHNAGDVHGHVPNDDDRASDSDREDPWEGSQVSGADEFVNSTDDEFAVAEAREIQRALRALDEVNL